MTPTPHIQPAPHEVTAWFQYTSAGLSPYYALQSITKGPDYGDGVESTFDFDGEDWTAALKPRSSSLAPKDDPEFQFEKVREFELYLRPERGDGPDERKATYHIAPRWPDLKSKGDGPNPASPLETDGIAAKLTGSNLPLDTYPILFRKAMGALSINERYFEDIHSSSAIQRFERYLRGHVEKTGPLLGKEGLIERVAEQVHVEGSKGAYRWDNSGTEGYNNAVKFSTEGASELIGGHALGKQVKHYHPKYVRSEGSRDRDPLAHPKVGVCFFKGLTSSGDRGDDWLTGNGSVQWSERDRLVREVDELLLNLFSWAGLSTRADYRTYVPDAHFAGEETASDVRIIDNPLPEIRREQGATVDKKIVESNGSDREVLQAMTDGGQRQTVDGLADETGLSTRTIYRKVEHLSEIIETRQGDVRFCSSYIRDKITAQMKSLAETVRESADRDASDEPTAWARWSARYGLEVDDRGARMKMRLGEVPAGRDMKTVLKDLYHAWPGDEFRFRNAQIRFKKDGFEQVARGDEALL